MLAETGMAITYRRCVDLYKPRKALLTTGWMDVVLHHLTFEAYLDERGSIYYTVKCECRKIC